MVIKFVARTKDQLFKILLKTMEFRKIYLRGPNSKTLTLPGRYCSVLDMELNETVKIKVIEHEGIRGIFVIKNV